MATSKYSSGGLYGAPTTIESTAGCPLDGSPLDVIVGMTPSFRLANRWNVPNQDAAFASGSCLRQDMGDYPQSDTFFQER